MLRKQIILLTLFFASHGLVAQVDERTWTLEECIDYALEQNIDVRRSALNIQMARNDINAAWADLFPDLNASFAYNFNFGLNIDPVTNLISRQSRQTSNLGLNSQ